MRRRPRIEVLEGRVLLTGDVTFVPPPVPADTSAMMTGLEEAGLEPRGWGGGGGGSWGSIAPTSPIYSSDVVPVTGSVVR